LLEKWLVSAIPLILQTLGRLGFTRKVVRVFHICTFIDALTGSEPSRDGADLTKSRRHP